MVGKKLFELFKNKKENRKIMVPQELVEVCSAETITKKGFLEFFFNINFKNNFENF